MATDIRYQDNLVLKKDAFQNLLTNIKNYPIIDIDYVTETDTDELHGDQVWPNYTNGMPCIKITYGDDRTTKGNVIFAEEERVKINKYKKILNQLKVSQNECNRLYNRWVEIYNENKKIFDSQNDQIHRYFLQWSNIQSNKMAFLKAGWDLLYFNTKDLIEPLINGVRQPSLSSNIDSSFEYLQIKLDEPETSISHTISYTQLNANSIVLENNLIGYRDLLVSNRYTRDGREIGQYYFTEEERGIIQLFLDFIRAYNYLSFSEAIGVANYDIRQIIYLQDGEYKRNNSNYLNIYSKVADNATFSAYTSYYSPVYDDLYVNIPQNAVYNSEITYYQLSSNGTFEVYNYIDDNDFTEHRDLLYTKQIGSYLMYYENVTNITAENFDVNKDHLYIATESNITIPEAIANILPKILSDLRWENNSAVNLSFDGTKQIFHDKIQSLVSVINDIINQNLIRCRTEYNAIQEKLNGNFNIITGEDTILVDKSEENIITYSDEIPEECNWPLTILNPSSGENINPLVEDKGINLKIQIIEEAIEESQQVVLNAASNSGENDHTLYGYKYVKVGSNITFEHNLMNAANEIAQSYEQLYPGYTYPEIDPNSLEPQRTGTFRIDINGHTYEIGVQGLIGGGEGNINLSTGGDINLSSGGDIYLIPSDDNNENTIGNVYIQGNTHISENLYVEGTSQLNQNVTIGTPTNGADLTTYGNILPGQDNTYIIGSTDIDEQYEPVTAYSEDIQDFYHYGLYPLTASNFNDYQGTSCYYYVQQDVYKRVKISDTFDSNETYYIPQNVWEEEISGPAGAASPEIFNNPSGEDTIYWMCRPGLVEEGAEYIEGHTYYSALDYVPAYWYDANEVYYEINQNEPYIPAGTPKRDMNYYRIVAYVDDQPVYELAPSYDSNNSAWSLFPRDFYVLNMIEANPSPQSLTDIENGNYYIAVGVEPALIEVPTANNFNTRTYYEDKYFICNPQPTCESYPNDEETRYLYFSGVYTAANPQPQNNQELHEAIYATKYERTDTYVVSRNNVNYGMIINGDKTYYGEGYYLITDETIDENTNFNDENNIYYQKIYNPLRWKSLALSGDIQLTEEYSHNVFGLKNGTSAQFLRGNGANQNPVWTNELKGNIIINDFTEAERNRSVASDFTEINFSNSGEEPDPFHDYIYLNPMDYFYYYDSDDAAEEDITTGFKITTKTIDKPAEMSSGGGVIIGGDKPNDGSDSTTTSLYYKTSQDGRYIYRKAKSLNENGFAIYDPDTTFFAYGRYARVGSDVTGSYTIIYEDGSTSIRTFNNTREIPFYEISIHEIVLNEEAKFYNAYLATEYDENTTYYIYNETDKIFEIADPQPTANNITKKAYYTENPITDYVKFKNNELAQNIYPANTGLVDVCNANTKYDISNQNFYLLTGTGQGDPAVGISTGIIPKGSIVTYGGICAVGSVKACKVHGAVFNDYAEYRSTIDLTPGHIVVDNDDGTLSCATKRLQPGAQVISDTFGFGIGETFTTKTPLAVSGRVLVYTYRPREEYHAGMAVCSAPNGTVDIMTREEIRNYPDCIIGIVSEIPQYETWGSDNINVDGRIWIKVK